MPTSESRRLQGLLVSAFALRVAYCLAAGNFGTPPARDYREYITSADGLLQHQTLTSPFIIARPSTEPSAILPPAYAFLVAGAFSLFGVETPPAIAALQLLNAAATTLAVLFLFHAAGAIFNRRAAWIAAVIAALHPVLIGLTYLIWDTCLFTLGVIVAVWLSTQMYARPRGPIAWLGFGAYLGALALLNPALTIAYPLLVIWPVSSCYGWRIAPLLSRSAAALTGWALVLTPWTVRNAIQFKKLFYVRSGLMFELYMGLCPEADEEPSRAYRARFPLLNDEAQARVTELGEREYLQECSDEARAAFAADPARFAQLLAIRTFNFWTGAHLAPSDLARFGIPNGWPRRFVMLLFTLETLIVISGFLLVRPLPRPVPWLVAILIAFSLVYCVTHVQVRFRAPLEPVFAVLIGGLLAGRSATRKAGDASLPTVSHR